MDLDAIMNKAPADRPPIMYFVPRKKNKRGSNKLNKNYGGLQDHVRKYNVIAVKKAVRFSSDFCQRGSR